MCKENKHKLFHVNLHAGAEKEGKPEIKLFFHYIKFQNT